MKHLNTDQLFRYVLYEDMPAEKRSEYALELKSLGYTSENIAEYQREQEAIKSKNDFDRFARELSAKEKVFAYLPFLNLLHLFLYLSRIRSEHRRYRQQAYYALGGFITSFVIGVIYYFIIMNETVYKNYASFIDPLGLLILITSYIGLLNFEDKFIA